ncbi:WD40-repeat-containing domain protein [Halteromyces radiatus]|uniref:WD40-repeat-containing domain protein n=1 Tax=Halteromyces radiatus TaxID=101107 RepID=UPI002220FE7B|nr:WD40-repeat-containing domain protein [Halteromyces radiatus]KAI8098608.1 WD40-repeat-containing domain protein [Halteromyces radiatus]
MAATSCFFFFLLARFYLTDYLVLDKGNLSYLYYLLSKKTLFYFSPFPLFMSLDSHTETNELITTDIEQTKTTDSTLPNLKQSTQHEPTYIHQLSIELVAHIFARLDPTSLTTVAKTCRYWRHIVMDDVCWKNAFLSYFGQLPYKRIRTDSWKSEYILRTHLLRKWEKGRGTLMTFNPKIGSIDRIFVDFENSFMMAASKEQGVAVKCNPSTGKLDRHLLYSTDEGMPTQVSAIKMDSNRVLWGFSPGYITMTTRAKTLVRRQLKVFSDFHQGAVRVLCMPPFAPDIVLSGGDDGMVKIWNVNTGLSISDLYGSTSSPTALEATSDHHVIAGYTNGTIVIWDIQLGKLINQHRQQQHSDDDDDEMTTTRRLIHAPLIDKEISVQSIHYDTVTQSFLVAYNELSKLYQYNVNNGQLVAIFGGGDQLVEGHSLGTICAVTLDIESSLGFTDETTLDSRMTSNKNSQRQGYKKQYSSLYSPASLGSGTTSPTTTSSSYERLVATGDTFGTICLWCLDREIECDKLKVVRPLRQFHGHQSPISVIHLDAFKIVSGADDGWIRVWDPLTGELLQVIGNKIPRHAPVDRSDVSVMRVKNLVCDEYRGVATIGHQIKSWDFSSQYLLNRRTLRGKAKAPSPAIRDELHYEIKQEVKASQLVLAQEKKQQELAAKEMEKWTMGGLSDEEIMAYAMMISQEPNNITTASSPSPSYLENGHTNDNYDEDEALLQAVMASLEMSDPPSSLCDQASSITTTTSTTTTTTMGIPQLDADMEWPTIEESHSTTATTHNGNGSTWNDEDDEELQYVLKLSRGEI